MWHWFPGFSQRIFVQALIFMDFTTCSWNIFNKRYPYARWHLLEGVHKIRRLLQRALKRKRAFIGEFTLSYIVWLSGDLWDNCARSKAILFEKVKYCTVCANDKSQASYCMLFQRYRISSSFHIFYLFLSIKGSSNITAKQAETCNRNSGNIIEAVIPMCPEFKNFRSTNCYIGSLRLLSFTEVVSTS